MPAKLTTDFHITVSPGPLHKEFLEQYYDAVWEWAKRDCTKYARVYECGSGTDLPTHFHVGVRTKVLTRQDNIKRSLQTLLQHNLGEPWTSEERFRTVRVNAHHNLAGLVGGYHTKEGGSKVEYVGFLPEELEAGKQEREDALVAQKRRDLAKDKFFELLAGACLEGNAGVAPLRITASEVNCGVHTLLGLGYRFSKHLPAKWGVNHLNYIDGLIHVLVNKPQSPIVEEDLDLD